MSGFQIQTYTIKTKKLKKGTRLTLSLLADLHNREYGPGNAELFSAIRAQRPDVILVAGDMLVSELTASFEPAQNLIGKLQREVAPVYYGNGNHESRLHMRKKIYGQRYEEFKAPLCRDGVEFLENRSVNLQCDGGNIRIHGFEMDLSYYGKFRQIPFADRDLTEALGTLDPETYHILLAHNPVYFKHYAAWGADLTLSGHLHGGIIRLPLIGGVITPQARLFPKYDRGLFELGEQHLVVSPGLGTHTVNIRFLNPAWLVTIYLEGDA